MHTVLMTDLIQQPAQ